MQRRDTRDMGFQPESYVGAKLSAADVVHIAGAGEWDQDVKGNGHVITMAPQQFEESSIHIENAPQCYAQGELEVGDMMVLGMRALPLYSLHVNLDGQRANSN